MSDLAQEGWNKIPLGGVVDIKRGITYIASELTDEKSGTPLYVNMKSFKKDGGYNVAGEKYFGAAYRESDLAGTDELFIANTDVTPTGDIIGAPAVVPKTRWARGILCSHHVSRLIIKNSTDNRYLYHLFCSDELRSFMKQIGRGTTVKMLDNDALKKLSLTLPPLPEQQKIATILSSVDDVIEKTRAQIDKLKDLKTGMMQELLTKGIGSDGVPHTEFKDSPVGRIPVGWKCDVVGNLFEIQLGKMLSSAAKIGASPLPYLGNKNVQWGKVNTADLPKMDFSNREQKKFALEAGDLLMCEGGEVGRSAIWKGELGNCYYQKAIHRLRPVDAAYEPRLLLEYMKYAKARSLLTEFISQTSIAHLTQEKLATIPVPVPPMAEQKRIVDLFSSVDNRIDLLTTKLQKTGDTKKALMQDLLTGKVRANVSKKETAAA